MSDKKLPSKEINDVVKSVYWLLRFTSEEFNNLSPEDQLRLNQAWAEIREFYETKFNYTRSNKYIRGPEKPSPGQALKQRSVELAQAMGKVSQFRDT